MYPLVMQYSSLEMATFRWLLLSPPFNVLKTTFHFQRFPGWEKYSRKNCDRPSIPFISWSLWVEIAQIWANKEKQRLNDSALINSNGEILRSQWMLVLWVTTLNAPAFLVRLPNVVPSTKRQILIHFLRKETKYPCFCTGRKNWSMWPSR